MTLRLSLELRNQQALNVVRLLDGGSLRIYSGEQPSSVEADIDGEMLVEALFASPAFEPPTDGVAILRPLKLPAIAVETGTAGWFRVYTAAGRAVFDGSVSDSGKAELMLPTVVINRNVEVVLENGAWRQPG